MVCGTRDPLETPSPFMANAILNFHFDYLNPSLREKLLHPFFARNELHEFVELMFFFKKIVHCDLVVRLNDYSQQQP